MAIKNEITLAIQSRGMTLRGWARLNGFNPQTVAAVIGGFTGSRKIGVTADILAALKRDGFLPTT